MLKRVKAELDQITDAPCDVDDLRQWLRGQAKFLAIYYEQTQRPYSIRTPISMLAYALVDEMVLAGYDGRLVGVPDGLSDMDEWINVLENIRDALGEIRRDDFSEPSLVRAIELAKGEGLVDYVKGKGAKLTQKGIEAVDKVLSEPDLLSEEKLFLREIGKRNLTEQLINKIFSEEFR